ncbi:MAG: nucleotidyltransferase domain-containing protein [Hyphomicrobiaceae bacterium]|nr:nucleotidyltransferase domain-containing protein [Hyphomicrobiaceae bacterium]
MTSLRHIYAFGSLCRGEVAEGSDVDLLAIVTGGTNELSRSMFSIYSHKKIERIWQEGNPFAWHLHLESRPIFCSDNIDFLAALGPPAAYRSAAADCQRFRQIYKDAQSSCQQDQASIIFDLSAAFLGLRNFSTCYLLGAGTHDFTRHSARRLMGDNLPLEAGAYRVLERARLLCTRGYGDAIDADSITNAITQLPLAEAWMDQLMREANYA